MEKELKKIKKYNALLHKKIKKYNALGLYVADLPKNKTYTVSNPYTGVTRELTPMAESVYSLCMGAERLGAHKLVVNCLNWFKEFYPSEYMDLLD